MIFNGDVPEVLDAEVLAALPPEFRKEPGRPVLADETVDTL